MAPTRLAAVVAAIGLSLALATPALACTKDDTAYFDTFLDSSCLQTPLQNVELDPLGGLRLATGGASSSTPWDTDSDFANGVTYQSKVFGPVGVSTLATTGMGTAAALTLPTTLLPLTADGQNPVLSMTPSPAPDSDNVDDPSVQKIGATYVMWYSGTAEDGGGPAIFEATSPDGQAWTRANSGNPVMTAGSPGDFDAHGVFGPQVIYDASDASALYKMYYSGVGDVFGAIGFATSTDGLAWTKHAGPVLDHGRPGSADSFAALDPSVMKDGQTWKMWYTGDDSNRKRVAYATSQDGITWTKGGRVISPEDASVSANLAEGAFSPTVWKDGSGYHMVLVGRKFVSGTTYQTKLINASSSDGITWNTGSIALNQGGTSSKFDFSNLNSPYVLPDGSGFKLWYSGNSIDANGNFHTRIGMATSTNGNSWNKVSGPATGTSVLDIGTLGTAFDSRSASGLSVVAPGSTPKFVGFYSGTRGSDFKPRLGEATSADGTTWSKVSVSAGAGGAVLALGNGAAFDNGGERDPSPLYDAGTYDLYFTGLSSSGTLSIGRTSTSALGGTLQPDNSAWTGQAQVLAASGSGFDQSGVSHPSAVHSGANYLIYYTATDGSGNTTIGRASSTSPALTAATRGQVLTAGAAGQFDAGGVKDPVVLMIDATHWDMLYTGVEKRSDGTTVERTGFATSSDGVSWTKQGVVLNPSQKTFAEDESGVEPTGLLIDGTTLHAWTSGVDRKGRKRGDHWTTAFPTPASPAAGVPHGWATYQLGDTSTTVRDFRKIIRTSSAGSPDVTLWMSFLQPYSSAGNELWSSFFPVTVSSSSEDLNFLLNIRGVRWQARLGNPAANPSLDSVEIDHAPVQFVPSASVQTRDITPPPGQSLSKWGDMTVHASSFSPAGGGTASATVHVLDSSTQQDLVSQALNLGADTTISLFSIDGTAHPALQVRFDLISDSPFSATPLISSLKVLFNAAAQPPPPPPPPPPPAPVLTLAASAATVSFGQPVTLSGNLSQAGAPLGGQAVTLQQAGPGAAGFTTFASPATDAAGNYVASATPSFNTTYKATYTGVATEPTVQVTVRPLVSLKAVRSGKFGVFTGAVAPTLPNEAVQIQQLKSGAWVAFGTAKTDTTSHFKLSKAIPKCGKFTFKAVDAAGAVHDLGESLPAKVELHRLLLKVAIKKRTAAFTGKVSPFHKSGTVLIKRVVGKKLVKIGKAKLTKKSAFKLVKKLKKGKYVFVATMGADKCHFAGTSAKRKATVR